jgi:hypothetical protein
MDEDLNNRRNELFDEYANANNAYIETRREIEITTNKLRELEQSSSQLLHKRQRISRIVDMVLLEGCDPTLAKLKIADDAKFENQGTGLMIYNSSGYTMVHDSPTIDTTNAVLRHSNITQDKTSIFKKAANIFK